MHIDFMNGRHIRDSTSVFNEMHNICKTNKCEDCIFGDGNWIEFQDTIVRCDTARIKRETQEGQHGIRNKE